VFDEHASGRLAALAPALRHPPAGFFVGPLGSVSRLSLPLSVTRRQERCRV